MISLWCVSLVLFVLLGALNLYWGDVNQDEGWYLYASGQVRDGHLPYRDFAFTQGPVLPFVYARAQGLVDRWGVAGGRLFTLGLGFLAAIGAAWLAGRTAPRRWAGFSALLAFILIGGNVYQSYFTTVVKTYSLCATFLIAGLIAASFAEGRRGVSASFLSGLLLALAAGTRISSGAALPVIGVYLLLNRKALGDSRWISFGVGGMLGLLGIAIPFMLMAPAGFRFGMFEYHTFRSVGGLVPALVYKAGFISRFAQAYFLAASLAVLVILVRLLKPVLAPDNDEAAPHRFNVALWCAGIAITLVHFSAPFPYEDYQAFVFPVFAAALSISITRYIAGIFSSEESMLNAGSVTLGVLLFVLLASVASAFSSPINQDWFILKRDRIWWRLKEESSLQNLRYVGMWVREHAGFNGEVLTQDTYIAVEAGLKVPEGLEMGPFSYFPDMSREKATELHVLNDEMMVELLSNTEARVAAFSGYGLSIRCPEVTELPGEEQLKLRDVISKRYDLVQAVSDFGQANTTLRLYVKRHSSAPPEL